MKFDSTAAKKYILCSTIGTKLLCIKSHLIGITKDKIYEVIEDFITYGVIKNDENKEVPINVDYFEIVDK